MEECGKRDGEEVTTMGPAQYRRLLTLLSVVVVMLVASSGYLFWRLQRIEALAANIDNSINGRSVGLRGLTGPLTEEVAETKAAAEAARAAAEEAKVAAEEVQDRLH
jgi:hypothetical protein